METTNAAPANSNNCFLLSQMKRNRLFLSSLRFRSLFSIKHIKIQREVMIFLLVILKTMFIRIYLKLGFLKNKSFKFLRSTKDKINMSKTPIES